MPAEDISNLTLGTMIDRLEAQGTWKIDLDLSNVFTSEWRKVIEARLNYLKTTRNILLQDL